MSEEHRAPWAFPIAWVLLAAFLGAEFSGQPRQEPHLRRDHAHCRGAFLCRNRRGPRQPATSASAEDHRRAFAAARGRAAAGYSRDSPDARRRGRGERRWARRNLPEWAGPRHVLGAAAVHTAFGHAGPSDLSLGAQAGGGSSGAGGSLSVRASTPPSWRILIWSPWTWGLPSSRSCRCSRSGNTCERPSTTRLVLCGLAMGALLAAKFSAVFLLPVAAALLLAAVRWPPQPVPDDRSQFLRPYSRSGPDTSNASAVHGYAAGACAFLAMCLVATLVIQALYFSPGGLFLYSDRDPTGEHRPRSRLSGLPGRPIAAQLHRLFRRGLSAEGTHCESPAGGHWVSRPGAEQNHFRAGQALPSASAGSPVRGAHHLGRQHGHPVHDSRAAICVFDRRPGSGMADPKPFLVDQAAGGGSRGMDGGSGDWNLSRSPGVLQ